ncbi:MAG: hypothetical protein K2Q01_04925, partial [Rickettsiales bacterium]|nr:hypothetical protein [Rickettsiales bacterium]
DGVLSQTGYQVKGNAGYFKLDVHEGNVWCLVLIHNIFPRREHYFSKTEYPLDTFQLIGEMLVALEGKTLTRTYREHYELLEEDNEEPEEGGEESEA